MFASQDSVDVADEDAGMQMVVDDIARMSPCWMETNQMEWCGEGEG